MDKNDITLNYAFQEYIPEKDLENKGIKDVAPVLTYEEPRWTFKNTSEAMNIIKESDASLYEKIQDYVKEQHLPSENILYLDFGKSLRYDDEYMGDFSKETLEDKLDNLFIVRYSHDNDDGNLIDGGDEIVINDNETVSLLNGMIEEHVKENIKKYEEYKIKKNSLQKNQTWIWKDYDDLSGHLEAPDGTQYFSYDWTTKEYKVNPDKESWNSFLDADPTRDTSLSAFKDYAQNYIKNNIVKDKSLNIVFERNYIDTEKQMEEEEKKMAENETLADKYNRIDKLLKENEVYKDFVQKGIVKDDAFGLREITEKELKSVSAKEPVDIIKEIATQKELAEVPELFTREFKYRMKTRFPGPEKDPFIVAKAIINDWKTSKPDYIPALNKWLSDSLKKEGFSTKENLEKGFEKFFKKLSSPEQKHMQHKDSDIGQGR